MNKPLAGPPRVVLMGAGGHAKVVLGTARLLGWTVLGVCDPALARAGATHWRGLDVLGDDRALQAQDASEVGLLNGIGLVPGSSVRQRVHEQWAAHGFRFPCLVHPAATVDETASLADGVQVMAGAIVQADARIGLSTIVNTGAQVDHDCVVGAHAHLAPGVVLCGDVRVGAGAFLGAGCTVLPQLSIGDGALVAAGSVVSRAVGAQQAWAPHRRLATKPSASNENP